MAQSPANGLHQSGPKTAGYLDLLSDPSTTETSVSFSDVAQPKHLLATLHEMRSHEELCDVVLNVSNTRLVAHKSVLAASSAYFRAMFTGSLAESRQSEITIHDMDAVAFEAIIDYFYTCSLEITEVNVQDILTVAGLLQIKVLQQACCEFLKRKINWENCLGIAAFADSHSCNRLAEKAQSYAVNHFVDVVQSDEFLNISCEQLSKLVTNDMLNVHSEERVFEAVLGWIKYDPDNRQKYARELFSQVRFPLLSPEFLLNRVAEEDVIRNNRECCDLLIEATRFHLLPPSSSSCPSSRLLPRKPVSTHQYLYAIGGTSRRKVLNSGERFDLKEGKWKPIGDMNCHRGGAGVAALGSLLYVAGGGSQDSRLHTAERFDPHLNVWVPIKPMLSMRNGVGIASCRGRVYAIGGFNGSAPLTTAECYDPNWEKWIELPPMNHKRIFVGCCVLNDEVYAIGGSNGSALQTCEKYNPLTNKWTMIASMEIARQQAAVVALGSYIYAIGGCNLNVRHSSVERYDPSANEWVQVAPLLGDRSGAGVGVLDGFIYVCGGFDGSDCLQTVEKYDPLTNEWHRAPSMNCARDSVAVCVAVSKRQEGKRTRHANRSAASSPSTVPCQGYNST